MKTATEYADLKVKVDLLLDSAMTDKGRMGDLMAHYRVSGLYHYSLLNSILITLQGGTLCQSYKGWQALKRQVRRGEKAHIVIWRPATPRPKKEEAADEEAESQTETAGAQASGAVASFWLCKVFDVNQTDGEPLQYDHNTAVPDSFSETEFRVAARALGHPVNEILLTGARGYTDGTTITLSSLSNPVDKTKTLFHELGHCLLHHGAARHAVTGSAREIEAEIVSHLCCAFFGVPYDLSPAYVAAYLEGREQVRKSRCIRAAQKIIKAVLHQNHTATAGTR